MKLVFFVFSFILMISSFEVSEASFSKENNQSYKDIDQQGQALTALREVKRKVGLFANHSSKVGKIAKEMQRLIDFAIDAGFTREDNRISASIDHPEQGTVARFNSYEDQILRSSFHVEYLQTQYNSHITVAIKFADDSQHAQFFRQLSSQYKATLYFFECGAVRLHLDTGKKLVENTGEERRLTRVWNLDYLTDEFAWDSGYTEEDNRYLYP